MPWFFRIALIVLRATSWPRCFSPPRMRVYPQVGLSFAMRTASGAMSGFIVGRTQAPRLRPVVLLGDERPVPPQDCVGCHDAGHSREMTAAEDAAFHGEPAALVVGQVQSSRPVHRAEDTVLFEQVV